MTTRDPRSRDLVRPGSQGQGRDPTQSLSLSPEDEPSHPSLALGTHEAGRERANTRIESPAARDRTPPPPKPPPIPNRSADDVSTYVGNTLGSYKIHELLGKGGMGYVFRAEHVKLGREVALKLLRADYARRRDAVARFFQEARTVNRVRHRNIVDVTDFVELGDGTTFIIMEFLVGQSLGKWARTGIDLPRALAVLVQICDGLSAAHSVGVIHRDLKPDNVIVVPTSDGAELVKLLDFGVAKLVNRDDEDVGFQTAAGSVIGTPAYMSPEQAGGMAVDARSDIYSLGAIMYELFCGQPMFRGRSFGEYVRKHLTEMPPAPHLTPGGAGIDTRLEILIMRCLEKDPNNRFASILELRDSLLGMLGGMETVPPGFASLTASGVRPPPPTMIPAMMATVLPSQPIPQQMTPASGMHPSQVYLLNSQYNPHYTSHVVPPSTPWWVWFIGGTVAVGLGVGAALWYAGRSESTPIAQAEPTQQPAITGAPIETPNVADPVAAKPFELRFDSLPSAGVFAEGRSTELCRTPCAFNVDLADGGPADKRTYYVKSEGFKDHVVTVDLSGSQREFQVTLERVPTIVVADPPRPEEVTPPDPKGKGSRRLVTRKKPEVKPPPEKAPDPPPEKIIEVKPKPVDDLIDPTDGRRPDKKPPKKDGIDSTETIDPFRRKKSK
jgi:serine/threonine protein kinase